MRTVFIVITAIIGALIILSGNAAMTGAAQGFELFISNVFPALFPFFVCITALKYANAFAADKAGGSAKTALKLFLVSCISGYSAGIMLLKPSFGQKNGKRMLCDNEFSTLCAIMNLSSPVFIAGTVANRMLHASVLALPIAICHYGTALLFLILFVLKHGKNKKIIENAAPETPPLASIFPKAVFDSAQLMLKFGGTLIFFTVITGILNHLGIFANIPPGLKGISLGLLEITNGTAVIASASLCLRLKCAIICSLLSFGGVCVYMQAAGIADILPQKYFLVKFLHGIVSGGLCYLIYPVLFPASSPVSSVLGDTLRERTLAVGEIMLLGILTSAFSSLLSVFISKRTKA